MNELQLGLIGAGAVLLVGVVGYNAWQRAKIRRKAPPALPSDQSSQHSKDKQDKPTPAHAPSALPSSTASIQPARQARHSKKFSSGIAGGASPQTGQEERLPMADARALGRTSAEDSRAFFSEIALGASPQAVQIVRQGRSDAGKIAEKGSMIDGRIDCIVILHLLRPMTAEEIISAAQPLNSLEDFPCHKPQTHKPILIEGDANGQWQGLSRKGSHGQHYKELRIAQQLANRAGPLTELEFSEFIRQTQLFAQALEATGDFPEISPTIARARELDAFAMQCDVQLSINLISNNGPWTAQDIKTIALQDGLSAKDAANNVANDGAHFVKCDAQQKPIFTLQFGATQHDDLMTQGRKIRLLLDVPLVNEDILPFRLMVDYAQSLSKRFGARLVDDQRQALSEAALAAIEKRLMALYAQLEEAQLPAGSALAQRLFSE